MKLPGPLALFIVVTGCTRPAVTPDGGRLEVSWVGADTGRIAGRAVAEWCDSIRVLEVRVAKGDSGLALALYVPDSVRADSYPVLHPDRARSSSPAAAVALRWFAETAIAGFRGDSGAVIVSSVGPQGVTGRLTSRVQSVHDADRLTLRGSFRDVPVIPAARGCGSRPGAQPPTDVPQETDLDETDID